MMIKNGVLAPRLVSQRPKEAADLPQKPLARMAVIIFMLGSLAWDYADTCCNIAASMKIDPLKKLSRAVRQLRREYDSFRSPLMRGESIAEESRLALMFEEICEEHFVRLNYGVDSEKKISRLNTDHKMLVNAVQMAMTVLDTMKLYAAECDKWIRSQGFDGHSILADHFVRLAILLPQFAGDCYNPASEARRLTARILLKEIKQIDICRE